MADKKYAIIVLATAVVLPILALVIEAEAYATAITFPVFGKWFIFFAVGLRLFIVGIKQAIQPGFTAREIFMINSTEAFPIIRELGFANICFGLIGLVSLFLPEWRMASAFGSGIYYGLAGILHLVKKPVSANEKIALVSDLCIFIVLLGYVMLSAGY